MRATALPAISLSALLALAGCGGGGEPSGPSSPATPNPPSTPGTPSTPSASATVAMQTDDDGYGSSTSSFVPPQVSIARNGTVTFTNGTGVSHNVTFDGGAGAPANIGNHTSGSATRTFPTAGTFAFQCTNHAGMSGSVIVVP